MRSHTMRRPRLGAFLLVICAIVVCGFFALGGSAGAATAPQDPQTTNVPYLAWVGEQVRLVKCFDGPDVSLAGVSADFLVEDWSGDPNSRPQLEASTVKVFRSSTRGQVCAAGDFISLDPGMARIELDVNDSTGALGSGVGIVVKHQFLAAWMTFNDPTLTELAAGNFASTAQTAAGQTLGDPTGNGHFNPGPKPGILSVKLTGSFPLNGTWASLVGKSTVTLPADWATLANALATDSNPADANPAMRWDIHDNEADVEGHVTATPPCAPEPAEFASAPAAPPGTDAVDNCSAGGADGPFSRVFGDLSSGTAVGPFDPLRPDDTLLSNGQLDAADAPMPAARIDVSIAPNSGGSTDISGVGSLAPVDKTQTYSRDFAGNTDNPQKPHNLYAPFYDAYIPATTAPSDAASGIDGPATGNDFTGFLVDGPYHFWDIAHTFAQNTGAATNCLRYSSADNPQPDTPASNPGDYYQTPSGPTSVAVYTDEHGEAQVKWVPGLGYYFNSLIALGRAITNADGGCDLQNVGVLGTADITAVARYPYKPVNFPSLTSNTVHKDVNSLWSKILSYFPKGTESANANARIVVAHAQDIDGTPFAGEVVCFSSNAEGMSWFNGTINGKDLSGTSLAPDPKQGLGRLCVRTESNGNAAVEVFESQSVHVNVIADFTNEGILRNIDVDFTTAGSTQVNGPDPASQPGPVGSTAPTGANPPSAAALSHVAPALVPKSPPAIAHQQARIALARLVRPARGRHYVGLPVNSRSRTARVRLRLTLVTRGHHRTVRHIRVTTVTVGTNRLVKVTVPTATSKVTVALLR